MPAAQIPVDVEAMRLRVWLELGLAYRAYLAGGPGWQQARERVDELVWVLCGQSRADTRGLDRRA